MEKSWVLRRDLKTDRKEACRMLQGGDRPLALELPQRGHGPL